MTTTTLLFILTVNAKDNNFNTSENINYSNVSLPSDGAQPSFYYSNLNLQFKDDDSSEDEFSSRKLKISTISSASSKDKHKYAGRESAAIQLAANQGLQDMLDLVERKEPRLVKKGNFCLLYTII